MLNTTQTTIQKTKLGIKKIAIIIIIPFTYSELLRELVIKIKSTFCVSSSHPKMSKPDKKMWVASLQVGVQSSKWEVIKRDRDLETEWERERRISLLRHHWLLMLHSTLDIHNQQYHFNRVWQNETSVMVMKNETISRRCI